LPGSKNAASCGKAASASSTPAKSSFNSPSWRFCSEAREQVLTRASGQRQLHGLDALLKQLDDLLTPLMQMF
jgi:hypothetical protein